MRNKFHVGAVGKRVQIANLPREPELPPRDALELAAWLVATAIPLGDDDAGDALDSFIGLVAEAAEDTDLSAAAEARR